LPFKLNQDRRHHIPRQRRKVVNWRDYDASLRRRGSLTAWFTEEAIAGWRAAPRTTVGGQARYGHCQAAAKRLLAGLKCEPRKIVTDGLRSYGSYAGNWVTAG
jgi:hypothetical protein